MTQKPNKHGVINPIPGWTITTYDMGLDVAGPKSGSPIYAPADCRIVDHVPDFYNPGTGPQPLVLYEFMVVHHEAPCQLFYVSETFKPFSTTVGQKFKRGRVLGRYIHGLPNDVEIGWGSRTASSRRFAQQVGWHVGGNFDFHESHRPPGTTWGNSFQDYFNVR